MTSSAVIAQYNLLERLESLGPGDRYRARDTRLGRTVDLRLLPADFAPTDTDRTRVLDEARAVRGLSHPNVVALFDAGEHEGRIYFVFELPRGGALRRELTRHGLTPRRVLDVGIQVADALAEAHGRDLVHGALRADAIVVTDKDQVKVAGFGLPSLRAYGATHAGTVTEETAFSGPGSPAGAEAGELADIHALGALLYELVTGRPPSFSGPAARPVVPRELNVQSPPELDDVILRALAILPRSRYQSAATVAAELRSVLAMLDVREQEQPAAASVHLGKVLLLAATMLGVAAAVWWWVRRLG